MTYIQEIKAWHKQPLSGSMFAIYNDASYTMFAIPQEDRKDSFSPNERVFQSLFHQVTTRRIKCKTTFLLTVLATLTRKHFQDFHAQPKKEIEE